MRLPEYKGKLMLEKYGIRTPKGIVFNKNDYVNGRIDYLKLPLPGVVKAQNMIGGRAKSGGIKLCGTIDELKSAISGLFDEGFADNVVDEVLIEEKINIAHETYLSIAIDRTAGNFALIFSGTGGVEIESMPPDTIKNIGISNLIGLQKFHINYAVKPFVENGANADSIRDFIPRLYELLKTENALLAEINPLVLMDDGSLIAADAKIIIDDNVVKASERGQYAEESKLEIAARELGVNLVELGGRIAVISNGAGEGMATIDQIIQAGGSISHWIDLGGGALSAKPEILNKFIEAVMDTKPVVLLFTAFFQIGKCDLFAESIKKIYEKRVGEATYVPKIILRLAGRNALEATKVVENTKLLILDSSQEACERAAELSAGGE